MLVSQILPRHELLTVCFLKKKKIQTLIADILKSQKYYMSFEKKPRHLANISLAKEHEYLKKIQFTFCSNSKVQPFERKRISKQLPSKPYWH